VHESIINVTAGPDLIRHMTDVGFRNSKLWYVLRKMGKFQGYAI
jgi:hypothetical protein